MRESLIALLLLLPLPIFAASNEETLQVKRQPRFALLQVFLDQGSWEKWHGSGIRMRMR